MSKKNLRSVLAPTVFGVGFLLLLGANPVSAHDRDHCRAYNHPPGHAYGHFKKHHGHVQHEYRAYTYYPPRERVVYREPNYGGYAVQSPNFGNAVGGALGGYIGSQIGKGSGQLAATAAGAVAGYVIGGYVGNGY